MLLNFWCYQIIESEKGFSCFYEDHINSLISLLFWNIQLYSAFKTMDFFTCSNEVEVKDNTSENATQDFSLSSFEVMNQGQG